MESESLKRLGEVVVEQRKTLGWATREEFSQNVDLTYRTLTDLENGKRLLGDKAYAKVEAALDWAPRSIESILAGGQPSERETRILTRVDQEPDEREIKRVHEAMEKVNTQAMTLREMTYLLTQLGWESFELDGPYQPDLLVKRGDQVMVIELRRARDTQTLKTIQEAKSALENHPEPAASSEAAEGEKNNVRGLNRRNQVEIVEMPAAAFPIEDEGESERQRRIQDEQAEHPE